MWAKKNKTRGRDRDRSISGPSLIGTTRGSSPQETISKSPDPPQNISKDLPALPITANDSDAPRAPLSPIHDYQEYSRYGEDPDISPPDSPIDATKDHYSIHDVSPIADDGGHFFASPPTKKLSQIPVSRRHSHGALLKENSPGASAGADLKTKPAMRKASTQQEPVGGPALLQPAKQRSKQHQASHLLHSGKEKLQSFSKTWEPKQRPPRQNREQWKGASGRAPLMSPIETSLRAKKDRSRSNSPSMGHDFVNYSSDTYMVTTITAGNPTNDKSSKKVRQSKSKLNLSSPPLAEEQIPQTSAKLGHSPRASPDYAKETIPEISSKTSHTPRLSPDYDNESGSQTPTNDKRDLLPETPKDLSTVLEDLNLIDEPRSRFSSSTYAPTEIATTPPGSAGSDTPPVPAIPPSPIMTRRRPVPSSAASVKSMKRKPVGSESPPPEVDLKNMTPHDRAQYRINSFQLRSNELSKRKASVKTMLHELTQVIQPSSIAYDMATRDEVKKSVISLNNELAEITKEEHDIGVKLSRAYRKLESADAYEHSSLWVKSITN
ncbi:hypothetical protein BGW36DRAFT_200183 [Talaromyces proteolyticus]|uniref:Uncharacterized protein n=1 Tax=Talaromyces proteolyticus TaxID=1131652 RepID=A0AAD4KT19_9EURO|nr:uncharacterized protein BGW36DRAFT_200183 [Talaromyces proteolyticus]KAH8695315.1 hypothetical protein BGW36DRAFT_200183 [Talaromyces proteolyticus]